MKIGEIKAETLSLMLPDVQINFDRDSDESINEAIFNLKASSNFAPYLASSVGAINRALAYLEKNGATACKKIDIKGSEATRLNEKAVRIELDTLDDFLYVEMVYTHTDRDSIQTIFLKETDTSIILPRIADNELYTIVYKTRIRRITEATPDSSELPLKEEICEALPYFIMAELLLNEDPEASKQARELFYKLTSDYERKSYEGANKKELYFVDYR